MNGAGRVKHIISINIYRWKKKSYLYITICKQFFQGMISKFYF